MLKYVIVRSNRLNNFGDKLDTSYSKVMNMFDDSAQNLSFAREIRLASHLTLPPKYFNSRLKNLDTEVIIVFDGHVRRDFLLWLQEQNPYKRIILWLWNTVEEISKNFKLNEVPKGIEIWSYSEYDCTRYGYKYNTTFFWNRPQVKNEEITSDIFYIGKDKGRYKTLLDLKKMFKTKNLKFDMVIVANHFYSLPKRYYSKSIPYEEVEKRILKAKAILDVKVNQNAGPSLRALEAAFYQKKLITDDKEVKKFKFYSQENIFILNEDPIDKLPYFLNTKNKKIDMKDIEYYSSEEWLSRFNV